MAVQSSPVYLVTCWTASSPCLTLRRVLSVVLASTTTSLICSGTCIGYGFRKEYSSVWPYWLSAVASTRRLRISLMSFIGLTRRNHGIDYGPVPVHAWSSANPTEHHGRPIISCDCCTCMEQSSHQHHGINLFAIFQETTSNISICQILPISFIFLLVICVPCSRSYCSLCHVNLYILLLLLPLLLILLYR